MDELSWPFMGSEALATKALPERVMRAVYRPVYPGVYIPSGIELTASQRAQAAWLWSRGRAVVAGQSAAALLGVKWVDPLAPAELAYGNRRPPASITVRSDTLLDGEVTDVDGVAVTTAARTAFDIGRRTTSRLLALQRLDALANATDVKVHDVEAVMAEHRGTRGLARLRRMLPLVDGGAESPQETRTRLALIEAGFPVPRTQIPVVGPGGYLLARVDMGWDEWRVGVEYDGAQHWTDAVQRTRAIASPRRACGLWMDDRSHQQRLAQIPPGNFGGPSRRCTARRRLATLTAELWIWRRLHGVLRRKIHTRAAGRPGRMRATPPAPSRPVDTLRRRARPIRSPLRTTAGC